MKAIIVATLMAASACAHSGPAFLRRAPSTDSTVERARRLAASARYPEADSVLAHFLATSRDTTGAAEALYWRAVIHLDPANTRGSIDTALVSLEAYLARGIRPTHVMEAAALRRLARSTQQLARVASALQQPRPADQPDTKARDDEAVKEIQRLKDELAKATAELDRIKKRLAEPKP